jgi:hypothetical protein
MLHILTGSGRASCMVTETASTISFYGVNDLKDVLELIKKNGFNSLEKCRSQRVICYIRVCISSDFIVLLKLHFPAST